MRNYTPINCSYYDELEALATLKKTVEIRYQTPLADQSVCLRGTIKTFEIRNHAEYMVLISGEAIRLDYLLSVDGKPAVLAC